MTEVKVQGLIAQFGDQDPVVRQRAALELGKMGPTGFHRR